MLDVLLQEDKDGLCHSVAYLVRKTTFAMAKYLPPPPPFFFLQFLNIIVSKSYLHYTIDRESISQ